MARLVNKSATMPSLSAPASSWKLLSGALTALVLFGCNAITGADQLVVDNDMDGDGTDDGPADDDGNQGGRNNDDGGSSTGAGSANGGGTTNGGSTGEGAGSPVEATGPATGFTIDEVAIYQAVKSEIFSNGASHAPSVTVVANRPAVIRVFVSKGNVSGAPVTARLHIGDQTMEVPVSGALNGSDEDYGSTINFDVPGSYITAGANWSVELVESTQTSSANPGASTSPATLAAEATHSLKVTIVPVMYQADGSNRMPDVSQAQLDRYQAYFMTLYPTNNVIVKLGNTLQWDNIIDASGNGWDSLLNQLSAMRNNANVAFDEYYYGVFNPAASFNQFCGGGCVAGLGFIGDPNGEYSRAAIGLGFTGDMAAWTAVHEVGHNHGRPHSPCGGVAGADGNYPHQGGSIGVWGMDIFGHQMVPPNYKDFMGYCEPTWISDYVYEEILDFMKATGGSQSLYIPEEERDQTYERINIGGANADQLSFLEPITLARPPMGTVEDVVITHEDGSTETVQGTYFRYDHLPGGVLFVKQRPAAIHTVDVNLHVDSVLRHINVAR